MSQRSVVGSICIYFLLGMLFLFAYGVLAVLDSGPLFAQGTDGTPALRLYFSFVTLSTVGYGDYTTASNLGHMLSVLEALIGQLYLVTVIAVLVSRMHFERRRSRQALTARKGSDHLSVRLDALPSRSRSSRLTPARPGAARIDISSLSTTSASRSPVLISRFSPAMIALASRSRISTAIAWLNLSAVARTSASAALRSSKAVAIVCSDVCCLNRRQSRRGWSTRRRSAVMPSQATATARAASQPGSTRRKPSTAARLAAPSARSIATGCTERGCKLDRDSMQPRSTFGSSYLELAADEQRQLMREFSEELLGSFLSINRLLERHGHRLVTLDSPRRRAVQVVLGAPMTPSGSGGRVIM